MWSFRSDLLVIVPSSDGFHRIGALAPIRMLLGVLVAASAWGLEMESLCARARVEGLAQDARWLALMHYAPSWRGERSVVDDPAFFLSPQGATDPEAELVADLRALLTPPVGGQPPFIARFPARSRFLCERLGIPREQLPVPRAEECEAAIASFQPRSATLVFASGYLGAPASMFGHTLLVVKGRYDSLALAQAINYAASTDTNNGLVFAVRGIFGGYTGFFSILPYHRKISEYADLDQRDLWEYDLVLNGDELRWMLMHIWELRTIGSDYWFFDENCSWRLLFLLDVARPSLGLHRRWCAWSIPTDTVRKVLGAELVSARRHRPSRRTRVLAELNALDDAGRDRVEALADGTLSPEAMTNPDADRELEAAAELIQTRLARGHLDLPVYQARLVAITGRRARLPARPAVQIPAPPAPETGHASARIQLRAGQDHGVAFTSLTIRPAYHDLTDSPSGYDPGTRIDFAQTEWRWYPGASPQLHRLEAVAIASVNPWDHLGLRPSYQVGTGLVREVEQDGQGWRRRAWLDGGAGVAQGPARCSVYALAAFEARVGQKSALGVGPTLGIIASPADRLRLLGVVDIHPGVAGERVGHGRANLTATWSVASAWSVVAGAEKRREWGVDRGEWSAGLRYYW